MKILCVALRFEAAGLHPPPGWRVWVLGACGRRASEIFESRLHSEQPRLVIGAGLAGGLCPDLRTGDGIFDPGTGGTRKLPPGWRTGRIATVAVPAATAEAKANLYRHTGADACDMESALLAAQAAKAGVLFQSMRAVGDDADFSLPVPPSCLVNPKTGCPDLPAMALALLARPSRIPGFMRMVRDARKARAALHTAIGCLAES